MELTIIGVYEKQAHARSAKYELIASGFARSKVQLNPDDELAITEGRSTPEEKGSTIAAGIRNFLRSLFGPANKSTYSNIYADAVKRGNFVLTVDVESDEQRTHAEEIMTHHGPVDIEERSALWVRQGWRGHDPEAVSQPGSSSGTIEKLRTTQPEKDAEKKE